MDPNVLLKLGRVRKDGWWNRLENLYTALEVEMIEILKDEVTA